MRVGGVSLRVDSLEKIYNLSHSASSSLSSRAATSVELYWLIFQENPGIDRARLLEVPPAKRVSSVFVSTCL